MQHPRVLTIAGSDPSGGAGIQADLKTFHALGAYGMAVVTALTAQNTAGVRAVVGTSPEFVDQQIAALVEDCPPVATKTGMLFSAAVVDVVARWAERGALGRLVVDPVMVATSGDSLLCPDAVEALRSRLLPHAELITPNAAEAEVLAAAEIADAGGARAAAEAVAAACGTAVLLKGGDTRGGGAVVDVLALPGEPARGMPHDRVSLSPTHGTGCTLSAAIAVGFARNLSVDRAIESGIEFVVAGLRAAFPVGAGAVPVNHFAGGARGDSA